MAADTVSIVEYTDPGCSWAWGTEPKLRLLAWRYGNALGWRRVMGGLVGDMRSYLPDFDAAVAAEHFRSYWASVGARTGMPHPARLARMYISTEPACRAVKAAERQGDEVARRVLRRLRESTFVFGDPPDSHATIRASVVSVPGLDVDRLLGDLDGEAVLYRFRVDWKETRAPNEYVRTLEDQGEGSGRAKHSEGHWRYVFPTLTFRGPAGECTVPGWKPYEAYVEALERVARRALPGTRADPSPAQVIETWGTAAAHELELLCGSGATAPPGCVKVDLGGGVLWLSPAEAAGRGL